MGSEDKTLFLSINSTGWLFATVIFLMLIFVMAIVNSIFFIRIYNQSKDRDSGTGITGLTVTGSLVIGIVSIMIGVIAFGWSLYLVSKIYKNREAVKTWYTEKKTKLMDWKKAQSEKLQSIQNAYQFFMSNGETSSSAAAKAQAMCSKMNYVPQATFGMSRRSIGEDMTGVEMVDQ
jgi:hypothetical protein